MNKSNWFAVDDVIIKLRSNS